MYYSCLDSPVTAWLAHGNVRLRFVHLREKIAILHFRMKRYQELGDIFPLSDEDLGSGSNTIVEAEPASGSGLGDNDSFSEAKLPDFLESLRGSKLKEKLSEEDLLL